MENEKQQSELTCPRCGGGSGFYRHSLFRAECLTSECRITSPKFDTREQLIEWWTAPWHKIRLATVKDALGHYIDICDLCLHPLRDHLDNGQLAYCCDGCNGFTNRAAEALAAITEEQTNAGQ